MTALLSTGKGRCESWNYGSCALGMGVFWRKYWVVGSGDWEFGELGCDLSWGDVGWVGNIDLSCREWMGRL